MPLHTNYPATDFEWRSMILTELRELRKEFQEFQIATAQNEGERKGRLGLITVAVSAIVSIATALLHSFIFKK